MSILSNCLALLIDFNLVSLRTDTVRQLLDSHPELVGPYTAYGGAMYAHTPLHLGSRNGHKYVVSVAITLSKSAPADYRDFLD